MKKVRGKTVLITGGASGIGLCTACEFAKAGSRLILTDIDEQKLAEAERVIRDLGAEVTTYVNDVRDRKAVEKLARDVLERFGNLDILINNAGVGLTKELKDTTMDEWKKLIDINLWGPLYFIYAFLPSMLEKHSGHIVNISSGQAFFRLPTWGAYAAIKLCLSAISEVLYFEMAPHKIKVTAVHPFMVNTGFYDTAAPETFGGKLSMKLLPFYSSTPDKVGKIIFNAVRKEKMFEMAHIFNTFGYYSKFSDVVNKGMGHMTTWFLAKHEK